MELLNIKFFIFFQHPIIIVIITFFKSTVNENFLNLQFFSIIVIVNFLKFVYLLLYL